MALLQAKTMTSCLCPWLVLCHLQVMNCDSQEKLPSKSSLPSCHCHFLVLSQNRSMKTERNFESHYGHKAKASNRTNAILSLTKHVLLMLSCSLLHGHRTTTARHTGYVKNDQAVIAWTAVYQPTDNSHWCCQRQTPLLVTIMRCNL